MILHNLPNGEYHARPEVSKSQLDLIARSPAHYRAGFQSVGADTAVTGSALHSLVLEGGRDVAAAPDRDRRSKADRLVWQAFIEEQVGDADAAAELMTAPAGEWAYRVHEATGRLVVKPDALIELHTMADAVRSHRVAGPLLDRNGAAETSVIGAVHGVPARARPDWWTTDDDGRPVIVDLKTTMDARASTWRWSAARYRYPVQQAWYSRLVQAAIEGSPWPRFVFVVVEKAAPYGTAVYELASAAIENAEYLIERDIETLIECRRTDSWPSYLGDAALEVPILDAEPDIPIMFDVEEVAA